MYNQFFKEVLEVLKDKKNLLISILLPIFLIPSALVLVVLLSVMLSENEQEKTRQYQLLTPLPPVLQQQLQQLPHYEQVATADNYQQLIQQGQLDFAIKWVDNEFSVFFNQADLYSPVRTQLQQLIDQYQQSQQQALVSQLKLEPELAAQILSPVAIDWQGLVSNQQLTSKLMLSILPLIMLVMVCISAVATSADMLAGEKERQTIQTTLLAPVSILHILLGKWLAVCFFAALSALLTLMSLFAAVYLLYVQLEFEILQLLVDVLSFKTMIAVFIFNLPNCFLISALLILSSTLAGNFKEAQSYGSVLMLLCTFPLGLLANVNVDMTWLIALVPMLNIQSWLKGFSMQLVSFYWWGLILLSYFMLIFFCIYLSSKLAARESMLFSR